MNRILLQGCQTQPLASYLKALGILRLVAEQADENATGRWTDDGFELSSRLDKSALIEFFIGDYYPTPVIAPWNSGSGFYRNKTKKGELANKSAVEKIEELLASETPRMGDLRISIGIAQGIVLSAGLEKGPETPELKHALVNRLRAELPDKALDWLDATLSLSGEGQKFPPLLGTGGNDGRLDFTVNFMQRLTSLIDADGKPSMESRIVLEQALFESSAPHIKREIIGQFDPNAAGSPNGTTGFSSASTASPWDYVLMIEGAMLFASAAVRRLESNTQGALSFPFTTRAIGAGTGAAHAADEANARAEIWLPLWSQAAGLNELKQMFSEGRVTLGRRNPRDGLEFARAVSQLGNARGIHAFERYAFLMRAGKAYVATPIGRFTVPHTPSDNLLRELEYNRWLGAFDAACRDANAPARLRVLQAPLRDQMFAFTQANTNDRPERCQAILQQLGEIERYAARSPAFREKVPPLATLSVSWSSGAEDPSDEFQIAAAIAGLHSNREVFTRQLIAPVDGKTWRKGGSRDLSWQHPDLARCMGLAIDRLSLYAQQHHDAEHGLSSYRSCQLAPIAAWLHGDCDDARIHRLVPGLALCKSYRPKQEHDNDALLPPAYRILKLLFCGNTQMQRVGLLPKSVVVPNPRPLMRLLLAGDTPRALEKATRRLQISGLSVPSATHHIGVEPERLLAALLIPITDSALLRIAIQLNIKPKFKKHAQGESA